MKTKPMTTVALGALALALAGCAGTVNNDNPIGIGTGPNSLKQSPCACMPLPNAADEPGFVPPQV